MFFNLIYIKIYYLKIKIIHLINKINKYKIFNKQ